MNLDFRMKVMASAAHVILVGAAPGAQDYARGRLEELERRWSRFRPDSEVSRLNEAPGAFLVVSADTVALLAAMKEAWRVTEGRYDPTMLAAIVAAGYDTSVDGSGRTSRAARGTTRASRRATVADVHLDAGARIACVPAGAGLDPGGIGKGLAADLVVAGLLERGTAGALVSVGGDLAAAGEPPTPGGWLVRVEDPLDPSRALATLALRAGGVATSSTLSRRWRKDGSVRHHALDPVTGLPSATDLAAVTVVARAGWEAEAHATAALLAGDGHALDHLVTRQLEGVTTTHAGVTATTPGLDDARSLEGSAA